MIYLLDFFRDGVQAFVSLDRIEKFLNEEEIDLSLDVDHGVYVNHKIAFENATITWNKKFDENEFIIKDLNIEFPVGELSIICEYVRYYTLYFLDKNFYLLTCYHARWSNWFRKVDALNVPFKRYILNSFS